MGKIKIVLWKSKTIFDSSLDFEINLITYYASRFSLLAIILFTSLHVLSAQNEISSCGTDADFHKQEMGEGINFVIIRAGEEVHVRRIVKR